MADIEVNNPELTEILANMTRFMNLHYDDVIFDHDGNPQLYVKKALFAKVNDMSLEIYPNDHNPPHFHVKSKQRKINVRLNLYTLEPLDGELISNRDLKKIRFLLQENTKLHKQLIEQYKKWRVSLS